MTPVVSLCILAGLLFGCGVVLVLSRSIIRGLLGVLLMSNGVNLLFVVASGPSAAAPIISKYGPYPEVGPGGISDPVPQALMLTAIVITLAVTGYVLALAHRSWQLSRSDIVEDDREDTRLARLAEENDISTSDYRDTADPHALADEASAKQASDFADTDDPVVDDLDATGEPQPHEGYAGPDDTGTRKQAHREGEE